MEFLPYPHLIATLFNGCACGPPLPLTAASAWMWVDHPVSGLAYTDHCALLRLGLPAGPWIRPFTLAGIRSSPDRSTKSTRSLWFRRASTACGHGVSGSLSLPSRGPFHLSLTVLSSIGHFGCLALGGGPPCFLQGSTCLTVLWYRHDQSSFQVRGFHPLWRDFPKPFFFRTSILLAARNPGMHASRFGLLRVRSPLLAESIFLSFPPGT